MNRAAFYRSLRSRHSGVFGTSLTQGQVRGMDAILDEGERRCTPPRHLAYILATGYHETDRKMLPTRENLNYSVEALLKKFPHRISEADARSYGRLGSRPANQRAIANCIYGGEWGRRHLGNTRPDDGWLYRGGGLPQITGRANFTKLGMAADPDRSADLLPAVRMTFDAMERGIFTGKKLSDFTDYRQMRTIINGTDRAADVARYAEAFERALTAAGYLFAPAPAAPQPKPAPNFGPTGIAAFIAALLALIGVKRNDRT